MQNVILKLEVHPFVSRVNKKNFWNIFGYSQLASQSSLHFLQNTNLVLDVGKLQKMSGKVGY